MNKYHVTIEKVEVVKVEEFEREANSLEEIENYIAQVYGGDYDYHVELIEDNE